MSATVVGLENLMKTFFEESDDEKTEKDAGEAEDQIGKSEGPAVEVEGQGEASSREAVKAGKRPIVDQGSPVAEKATGGHSTASHQEDDDVELIHTPKRRRSSASPEGALSIMERNFDATRFIDSQLIPGTEEHFLGTELAGQARWMYRTLLRGAVIARKAEFELSGMQALRRKLESSVKANNDFKVQVEQLQGQLSEMTEKLKVSEEKAAFAAEKLKVSDESVARLIEREMTLEGQLNSAQGRVAALEKERDEAVSLAEVARSEVEGLKKKLKATKDQGKNAITMTEDALKAQIKIVAPDFDTSAIGVFKMIQDGKVVDMPRK